MYKRVGRRDAYLGVHTASLEALYTVRFAWLLEYTVSHFSGSPKRCISVASFRVCLSSDQPYSDGRRDRNEGLGRLLIRFLVELSVPVHVCSPYHYSRHTGMVLKSFLIFVIFIICISVFTTIRLMLRFFTVDTTAEMFSFYFQKLP